MCCQLLILVGKGNNGIPLFEPGGGRYAMRMINAAASPMSRLTSCHQSCSANPPAIAAKGLRNQIMMLQVQETKRIRYLCVGSDIRK
jgi:hypothetical protein